MRLLRTGACALLVLLAGCGNAAPGVPGGPGDGRGTTHVAAGPATVSCASPEGFRVEYPADWYANEGDVLPACSWFAAQPFVVPEASDVRMTGIALKVEPASVVPVDWPDQTARSVVDVGGQPAQRVTQVTGPGFYPEGTPITTYVVDLGPARGGEVLVADAVGLPGFDHDRDVEVLDAMMTSLVLDGAGRA